LFDAKNKNDADLKPLPYEMCQFVLSTSPNKELINYFQKSDDVQWFFMPTSELESIAHLFPNTIDWRNRFQILGGIPRHVLGITRRKPQVISQRCMQTIQHRRLFKDSWIGLGNH